MPYFLASALSRVIDVRLSKNCRSGASVDRCGALNNESERRMVTLLMRKRIARTDAKMEGKSPFPCKTCAAIAAMIVLLLWAVEHPGNFLSQLIRVIFAP